MQLAMESISSPWSPTILAIRPIVGIRRDNNNKERKAKVNAKNRANLGHLYIWDKFHATLELKRLRRSLPKMVIRVGKGEPAWANPEVKLSRAWARVSSVTWLRYEKGNLVCPDSSHKTERRGSKIVGPAGSPPLPPTRTSHWKICPPGMRERGMRERRWGRGRERGGRRGWEGWEGWWRGWKGAG